MLSSSSTVFKHTINVQILLLFFFFSSPATTLSLTTTSNSSTLSSSFFYPRAPQSDTRTFAVFNLSNGIPVILVHSPDSFECAASMNIKAGSLYEPDSIPGLAHFLEHMLFMGTEKFTVESGFSQFLSLSGGDYNAYTGDENTNYFFWTAPDKLEEALDRFSQFFISPLLSESSLEREAKAVDSEYHMDKPVVEWALDQLFRSTTDPNHPYHRFSIGTIQTLLQPDLDIRKELFNFFNKYYNPQYMTISIYGAESIEVLADFAEQYFGPIQDKSARVTTNTSNAGNTSKPSTPFTPSHMMSLVKAHIGEDNSFNIYFSLPPMKRDYTQPSIYLDALITFEGVGSLNDALVTKGWGFEVDVQFEEYDEFTIFRIIETLTDDGVDNLEGVIGLTFKYIELLQSTGSQQWQYEQLQQMASIDFEVEGISPDDEVSSLSSNLEDEGQEHVLDYRFYFDEWTKQTEQQLNEIFSYLTPENSIIIVASPLIQSTPLTEPWFGTPYSIESYTANDIKSYITLVDVDFSLPLKNPFIPANLSLKFENISAGMNHPEIIISDDFITVWFFKDSFWNEPRASLYFSFLNPMVYSSPINYLTTQIFVSAVLTQARTFESYAEDAGLYYYIEVSNKGFELSVYGYNDKQLELLSKIFPLLSGEDLVVDEETFFSEYENLDLNPLQPSSVYQTLVEALTVPCWTHKELSEVIGTITYDDFTSLIKDLQRKLYIEIFAYGNIVQEDVNSIVSLVLDHFQPTQSIEWTEVPFQRKINLDSGCSYYIERDFNSLNDTTVLTEEDSALAVYFEVGPENLFEESILYFLDNWIYSSFFEEIRTKEQLGYYVVSQFETDPALGLYLKVESPTKDPIYLEDSVEQFLYEVFQPEIAALDDWMLQEYIVSAIVEISSWVESFDDQGEFYWSEILGGTYAFYRRSYLEGILYNLTAQDVQKFCDYYFFDKTTRRRFSSEFFGTRNSSSDSRSLPQTQIKRVSKWKTEQDLYPSPTFDSLFLIPSIYDLGPTTPTSTPATSVYTSTFWGNVYPISHPSVWVSWILGTLLLLVLIATLVFLIRHRSKITYIRDEGDAYDILTDDGSFKEIK